MLAICFWLNVVTQTIFICFAPIATVSYQYYGLSDASGINWLALIWCGLFPPFAFLAAWIFDQYGLRKGLIGASGLLVFASAIRCLSLLVGVTDETKDNYGAYTAVLIGSWLAGMAQPAIMSSTTLLATAWFNEKQRNMANGLV